MKYIVCQNEHCRNKTLNEVIEKLKNSNIEIGYTECMELCHVENKIFSLDESVIYQDVSLERLNDVLKRNASDLIYQSDEELIKKYSTDQMHLRTVKLFRWHLDKEQKCSKEEVLKMMQEFSKKYDVKGLHFINPIMIALTGNVEGPDLPDLIFALGKDGVMRRLDDYLKSKMNK